MGTKYILPNGYVVDVNLVCITEGKPLYCAHTNDYDAYQLIDHRWYEKRQEAQASLDEIAQEQGWAVWQPK